RLQELVCGTEAVHRLCADSGAVTPYRGAVIGDLRDYRLQQCHRFPLKAASQMTSYSALVAGGIHSSTVTERKPFSSVDAETTDFAELPSGASFGSAVHDILEEVSFAELLRPRQHRAVLHDTCNAYGLQADMTLLESMLQTVVSAPIGRCVEARFTLADINEKRCIKEMGFYFHLAGGETGNLNAILAGEESVCPIAERELAGFLTGFVDLIFEHEGVYYIADYKTNNLGPYLGDYHGTSLVEAMAQHNYGLQLWLYALVLHRHLANFLPGYDHGRHFGGVFYLFVRGMGKWPAGIYYRKPEFDTLERLGRCFGGKN
ncbi:MAG TPA: PD-(D/E)XK nuclease family protein, partial [Desulfopila sp.]|nr:PD-(D/E)XK nuclease family protein [Desulfopila sp.]